MATHSGCHLNGL